MRWRNLNDDEEPQKTTSLTLRGEVIRCIREHPKFLAGVALVCALVMGVLYVTSWDRYHENRRVARGG